ncbi:glycosyl hydrolase family 28-related protein [Streptomyces sp. NPDC056454]|uniref:glycosyl hydrolase family 28-related protein n=1 Tax=Streptomyces sp. NPDC056454 TaxID=3345823 RepID=UPI0036812252
MTFTLVPVTGTYLNGATPRTGTVRLQLKGALYNQGGVADLQPQVLTVDSQGKVATQFTATNDPDTLPVGGGIVEVTETLSGLTPSVYLITIPWDGGPVNLNTAPRIAPEDAPAPATVFQPVNKRGLPGGYPSLDDSGRVPRSQLPADLGGGGGGGGVEISGEATDIQPLGSRAAGSTGLAADAGHVHETPALHQLKAPTAAVSAGGQKITNVANGENPQDAATVAQLSQSVLGWINVKDRAYGAKGDGTTDDTAALQAALDACPLGGTVYIPEGVYRVSAPIRPHPARTLLGPRSDMMAGTGLMDSACYLQPLPSFVGKAVILLRDQASGGYASLSAEHRIEHITVDGSALEGTNLVDGLYAEGAIQNVRLDGVTIRRMSNNGIATGGVSNAFPYSWHLTSVMIDNCRANGVLFSRMTDMTMVRSQITGCWGRGLILSNSANSQMIGCRAERNGSHGIHLTGAWGTGTGSGGMLMSACSTDRNGGDGVRIDATGNTPITISNLVTRRDGRNGGSGGNDHAGLAIIGATVPVIANTVSCYPGLDDNGTGTNSPQYGLRMSGSTSVQADGLYLHAAQAGLYDDGTNVTIALGSNITVATGSTAAPVRTAVRSTVAVDWLNVKQFGAKGNGVTNDAPAIQSAINAASTAGGGTLYIPPGRYILNAALTWASNVNAVGAGDRVSILQSTNGNLDCITGTDISGVTLQSLQLSGPGRGVGSAVRFTRFSAPGTTNITLKDLFIQSFGGDGVFLHELASSSLTRVRVRTCGVGFHLQAPQDTVLGGGSTSLTACSAEGCVVGGFWLDGMAYTSLDACAVQGSPFGYRLDGCKAVSVTGSGAEQCTTGLTVYGGNGSSINSFVTKGGDGTSIWVTGGATGVFIGGAVEIAAAASATAFLRTDTGTIVTALALVAAKPNSLNGIVNRLDPGDGSIVLAGRTVVPSGGAAARLNTAVLVGGTVTVNTTAIGANSVVLLTTQTPGGTVGAPYVSARTAGASFTITSTSASDTSTVGWRIYDPS